MIVKKIKYEDFNGNEREEEFYFHLSKTELSEMELSVDGGYGKRMEKVIAAKNMPEVFKIFKELVLKSYGIKSEDGRRLEKSDEISKAFTESPAYDILFMEIASDPTKATEFFNGIIPKGLSAEIGK